ncbi:hypothetical protein BGW39_003168, partial [Mortierella sp. 14UC]
VTTAPMAPPPPPPPELQDTPTPAPPPPPSTATPGAQESTASGPPKQADQPGSHTQPSS